MTDIILQWQLMSASMLFPYTFKTVTLLFHITQFFSIGYIGEMCLLVIVHAHVLIAKTHKEFFLSCEYKIMSVDVVCGNFSH